MLEPIEIGSKEPGTPSDVAQLRTQLENRIEQKRRLSHIRSAEAENFPSLPVKDESITGAEGALQRTTKAHRVSQSLRNPARLHSPTNQLGEDAIAEALNESSGETSSLVESAFTPDRSKLGATPRKGSERNERRRQQLATPASRHVKFQDEEVILNPHSAAASASADDDSLPVDLASSTDLAGDFASGSASNGEEEQKIDETASQREEAADDLIGEGLV